MRQALPLKALIIGVLVTLLSGCSALRLAYDNGPWAARWWLDDWLDLRGEQVEPLDRALQGWFAWHRREALPEYASALDALARRAGGEVSADEVCRWSQDWRGRLDRALTQALPAAATLLPGVSAMQWQHLRAELARRQRELREQIAPPQPEARRRAAFERQLERAESFYGRLDAAQRAWLAQAVAASPLDAERWLDDRTRRQAAFVEAAQALQAPGVGQEQRREGLARAFARLFEPADAQARERQDAASAYSCQVAAELHRRMNADQREHLRQRLRVWAQDLQALAEAAPPGASRRADEL